METQAPKTGRWVAITSICLAVAAFLVACSALVVAVPHPEQYRVGTVPTMPMPIVPQPAPQPAAPDLAWDVEHVYKDGQYEVGKDIYEGKWKTAGKVDGPMGCSIHTRNAQGGTADFKYGDGQMIVDVHNGQTVEVRSCQTLTLVSPIPK
jgi:hypothetical protein